MRRSSSIAAVAVAVAVGIGGEVRACVVGAEEEIEVEKQEE